MWLSPKEVWPVVLIEERAWLRLEEARPGEFNPEKAQLGPIGAGPGLLILERA